MKTLLKNGLLMLVLTTGMTLTGFAADGSTSENTLPPAIASTKEQQMLKRLEELKAMNPENMTKPEKKAVRKEVKQIKKAMRDYNGVYISFGALIIIILLLILIL
ncbi:MAG: hypothetical protein U0X91_16570 [Spirosomataceae bacterium]